MNESPNGISWSSASLLMLVAVAASTVYTHWRYTQLAQDIDRRPPIAVVRLADFIEQMPPKPTQDDIKALYQRYGGIVDRLADAGYLVIDGQAVAGAPIDLYVPAGVSATTARTATLE